MNHVLFSGLEHVWERGWEDHERRQQQRLARLSLPEKIAWLEEAHRIVRHLQSQRPAHRSDVKRASKPE